MGSVTQSLCPRLRRSATPRWRRGASCHPSSRQTVSPRLCEAARGARHTTTGTMHRRRVWMAPAATTRTTMVPKMQMMTATSLALLWGTTRSSSRRSTMRSPGSAVASAVTSAGV
eukprot:31444-Rhodomonas_salina.1